MPLMARLPRLVTTLSCGLCSLLAQLLRLLSQVWVANGPGDPKGADQKEGFMAERCGGLLALESGASSTPTLAVACNALAGSHVTLLLPGAERVLTIAELRVRVPEADLQPTPLATRPPIRHSSLHVSHDDAGVRVCLHSMFIWGLEIGQKENAVAEAVGGVGVWGGSCSCPDGSIFQVSTDHCPEFNRWRLKSKVLLVVAIVGRRGQIGKSG